MPNGGKYYRSPNGKVVSESELKNHYGKDFDKAIADFKPISEPVYKAPNGKYAVDSELRKHYGDKYSNEIKYFEQVYSPVKKKESSIPTSSGTIPLPTGLDQPIIQQENGLQPSVPGLSQDLNTGNLNKKPTILDIANEGIGLKPKQTTLLEGSQPVDTDNINSALQALQGVGKGFSGQVTQPEIGIRGQAAMGESIPTKTLFQSESELSRPTLQPQAESNIQFANQKIADLNKSKEDELSYIPETETKKRLEIENRYASLITNEQKRLDQISGGQKAAMKETFEKPIVKPIVKPEKKAPAEIISMVDAKTGIIKDPLLRRAEENIGKKEQELIDNLLSKDVNDWAETLSQEITQEDISKINVFKSEVEKINSKNITSSLKFNEVKSLYSKLESDLKDIQQDKELKYIANVRNQDVKDVIYSKQKEIASFVIEDLPEGSKEQATAIWNVTSQMRDFMSEYYDPTGLKGFTIKDGKVDVSGISDPKKKEWINQKVGEYMSLYDKEMKNMYATYEDDIYMQRKQTKDLGLKIKEAESRLSTIDKNSPEYKNLQSILNKARVNYEKSMSQIESKDKWKNAVFNTDPEAIVENVAMEFGDSESAQKAFSKKEGISGLEQFQRGYLQLWEETKILKSDGDFDASKMDQLGQNIRSWLDWESMGVSLTDKEKEYLANRRILQSLAPIFLNNQLGITKESSGLAESFMNGFASFIAPDSGLKQIQTNTMSDALSYIQKEGLTKLTQDKAFVKKAEERVDVPWNSMETAGNIGGVVSALILDMAVTNSLVVNPLLKAGKKIDRLEKLGKSYDSAMDAHWLGKHLKDPIEQGFRYEAVGEVFGSAEDEMSWMSGFAGTFAGNGLQSLYKKLPTDKAFAWVASVFGAETDNALKVYNKFSGLNTRAQGEVAEEFTQELVSIYNTELEGRGFWDEVENRFGTFNGNMKFFMSSYVMGAAFGMAKPKKADEAYKSLTKEEQAAVDELTKEVVDMITDSANKVVNQGVKMKQADEAVEIASTKQENVIQPEVEQETIAPVQESEQDVVVETKEESEGVTDQAEKGVDTPKTGVVITKDDSGDTEYKIDGGFHSKSEMIEWYNNPENKAKAESGEVVVEVKNPAPEVEVIIQPEVEQETIAPVQEVEQDVVVEEKTEGINSNTIDQETEDVVFGGEAQQRREEGKYVRDGVEYVRNDPSEGVRGGTGEIRFTEGTKEKFTYKLIEADELQPSHESGRRNPNHFIPEAQPKNRTDDASKMAEQGFATKPRFESLGGDQDAYAGAPVVNSRGEVIQGNNRSAGLKQGYKQGSHSYKQDLANNAEQFGFSKDQVEGMNNPVLVREVDVDDNRAIELGNYDVKDMETGGEARIDATTLSRRMPNETKQKVSELLFADETQTLNDAIRNNQSELVKLIRPFLNQAQRNAFVKAGNLTKNSISDIEDVVKQFLFDGADSQVVDAYDNLSKTQQDGLRKSFSSIFGVPFAKNIVGSIQEAILALNSFKSSGIENFSEWLNQQDMFNAGKTPKELYSPLGIAIAEKISSAKKQSDISNVFADYANQVRGSKGDIFTDATEGKTKEEAAESVFGTSDTSRDSGGVKVEKKAGQQEVKETVKKPVKPKTGKEFKSSVTESIDDLVSWLDDLESKLDAFGKENLGMNLPVVVARMAIKAAKVAAQGTNVLSEIVDAAIQAVKESDWYRNQSKNQKVKSELLIESLIKSGQVLLAPNGKPSNLTIEQYKLVRTAEFKSWFGDWENDAEKSSRVIDENGEPKVLYHGTPDIDFDSFSNESNGEKRNARPGGNNGIWFTDNIDNAKYFSGEKGKIVEVFINARKPLIIDMENKQVIDDVISTMYKNPDSYESRFFRDKFLKGESSSRHTFTELNKAINGLRSKDINDSVVYENFKDVIKSSNYQVFNISDILVSSKEKPDLFGNALDFLNDLDFKLNKFGKETLGINLPILVAKAAIKSARAAVIAGKTINEAIQIGVDSIKNTDWYKSLSDKDKSNAEQSAIDMFKRPSEAKKDSAKSEGKTKQKESKGFSRVKTQELTEDERAVVEEINNKYDVMNQKEYWKAIKEIIDTIGIEKAIQYAYSLDPSLEAKKGDKLSYAQQKKGILMYAGSMLEVLAKKNKTEAIKNDDMSLLAKAEEQYAMAVQSIAEGSMIDTKAGQISAMSAELHKQFPHLFLLAGMAKLENNSAKKDTTIFKDNEGNPISVEDYLEGMRKSMEDEIRKEFEGRIVDVIKDLQKRVSAVQSKLDNVQKGVKSKSVKDQKSDIKKGISKKWQEFAAAGKENDGRLNASILPFKMLNDKQIDLLFSIITDYAKIGGLTAKQIVNTVTKEAKKFIPGIEKDHIYTIARGVKEFNEQLAADAAEGLSKSSIEELTGEKISEAVTKHYTHRRGLATSLAQTLIEEINLDADTAREMAAMIEERLSDTIEGITQRHLEKMLSDSREVSPAEAMKRRENRKLHTKLRKAIDMGALSNSHAFQAAFEKKFGFVNIDPISKSRLLELSAELADLELKGKTTVIVDGEEVEINTTPREEILRLQKEFNTLLDSARAWDYVQILREVNSGIYISILSDITSTGWKALIGSLGGATFGVISNSLKNPIASFLGIVATTKTIGSSFQRAATAFKTGVVEVGKTQQMGQLSGDKQSRVETFLFQELKKPKYRGSKLVKAYGHTLRNVRILAAMDAFLVAQTGVYYNAINDGRTRSGSNSIDAKMKNANMDIVYSQIANEEFENMKSDIEDAVDFDIKKGIVKESDRAKEVEGRLRQKIGSPKYVHPRKAYTSKRMQELRENQAYDSFQRGWQMGQYFSLVGKPDGVIGMATSWAQGKLAIGLDDHPGTATAKFAGNMVFKFVNLMGNFFNATVSAIPVLGIVHAFVGPGYDPVKGEYVWGDRLGGMIGGKYKANRSMFYTRIATNMLISTTILAALMDQFDWDDEEQEYKLDPDRIFDFRASGFGGMSGYAKNRIKTENYEEFSFSFTKDENGNFTNYMNFNQFIPWLNSIVATVGAITQDKKDIYRNDESESINIAEREYNPFMGYSSKVLNENLKGFLEGSFNSFGRIVKPFLYEESAVVASGEVLAETLGSNMGALINPAMHKAMGNYIESAVGSSKTDAGGGDGFIDTMKKKLAKDLYGMDAFVLKEKTDPFGNAYPETNDIQRWITELPKMSELYPETHGVLHKFDEGLDIKKWKAQELKPFGSGISINGQRFMIRDDIREEAIKMQEELFAKYITSNEAKKMINSVKDKNQLEAYVKSVQQYTKLEVKYNLVNKYVDVNDKRAKIIALE